MAGPFPGMDPYIEVQASWPDFHNRLIAEICNELGLRLPVAYMARVDERIEVASSEPDPPRSFRPDVVVGVFGGSGFRQKGEPGISSTATLEPSYEIWSSDDPEEIRITWVEIRALPDMELVTAIEVLSPVNKSWQGRRAYLDKREKLRAARVNLVEVDLLLSGPTLPMKRRIEPGAYYTLVSRGPKLPVAELYRWSVRDPLPRLPIPLKEPDADIWIDLAALVNKVYNLGRYDRTLKHDQGLPETVQLSPEDRAWAEALGKISYGIPE
jgi:hypothetical protein